MLRILIAVLALLALASPVSARDMSPNNQGRDQGGQAGRREGRERGNQDGRIDGENDGFQQGLLEGQQLQLDEAWAQAFQSGQQQGQLDGQAAGREVGQKLGAEEGQVDGERRGREVADKTALENVLSEAKTNGQKRASFATPTPDGKRDGARFGKEQAQSEARKVDFSQGREQYRQQQLESPHSPELKLRQAPLSQNYSGWREIFAHSKAVFGKRPRPGCDYRYCNYGSDNPDFRKGYRKGYDAGFRSSYNSQYDWAYDSAFRSGVRTGIRSAPIIDTQAHARSAFQKGYESEKPKAYEMSLGAARRAAYTPSFQTAYDKSFKSHYPEFYKSHYKTEEERAYQEVYQASYRPAFEAAREQSYAVNYPSFAKQEFLLGRKAEKADFLQRPIRLQGSWLTATDVPELFLVTVQFRNFSEDSIAGHRVRVHLEGESSRLYHDVPAKALVTVTGVFRLRSRPTSPLTLTASYSDGERDLSLGQSAILVEP